MCRHELFKYQYLMPYRDLKKLVLHPILQFFPIYRIDLLEYKMYECDCTYCCI